MKFQKLVYVLGFLLLISFLISRNGWTQPESEGKGLMVLHTPWWRATISAVKEDRQKLETKPPTIINTFAVEKGPYGYIWKIYIEAEDPDGDMDRIASVVEEPGFGRYFTDWIFLKPQYRKYFKGYIQWNTRSVAGGLPEWTPITLEISIIDKAGNESKGVVFPFMFESGVKDPYKYKLPAPFDIGSLPRIGYIHIDLFPPGGMGYKKPYRRI